MLDLLGLAFGELLPERNAAMKAGSDPSNVLSVTAWLSYRSTSARETRDVTTEFSFFKIPRSQSFFKTVYVVVRFQPSSFSQSLASSPD